MRYIWSKILLLEWIQKIIDENIKISSWDIFCDIFSWTANVAGFFKRKYKIISNDLLYFSYVIQRGIIKNNQIPKFDTIKSKIWIDPIYYFNSLQEIDIKGERGFIYNNYSPHIHSERKYFTNQNALKIDYIRRTLEIRKNDQLVDDDEYFYLLASLIVNVPSISNIAWTYWAYLKTWDWRVLKDLKVTHFDVINNWFLNECYNEDANELIKKIEGTLLYLDPPYNTRQYLWNYHILETIAKYDNPEIKGKTWSRKDDNKKSKYCSRNSVLKSFEDLIKQANFSNILLSYSTEGIMQEKEIQEIMQEYWISDSFKIFRKPYRRYKRVAWGINTQLEELLFFIKKK